MYGLARLSPLAARHPPSPEQPHGAGCEGAALLLQRVHLACAREHLVGLRADGSAELVLPRLACGKQRQVGCSGCQDRRLPFEECRVWQRELE
eukprot:scaffold15464_cov140-Isochrysis_galbana.AAC.2